MGTNLFTEDFSPLGNCFHINSFVKVIQEKKPILMHVDWKKIYYIISVSYIISSEKYLGNMVPEPQPSLTIKLV